MRIYKYSARFRVPALDQSDCSICYNYDLNIIIIASSLRQTSVLNHPSPHMKPWWHDPRPHNVDVEVQGAQANRQLALVASSNWPRLAQANRQLALVASSNWPRLTQANRQLALAASSNWPRVAPATSQSRMYSWWHTFIWFGVPLELISNKDTDLLISHSKTWNWFLILYCMYSSVIRWSSTHELQVESCLKRVDVDWRNLSNT